MGGVETALLTKHQEERGELKLLDCQGIRKLWGQPSWGWGPDAQATKCHPCPVLCASWGRAPETQKPTGGGGWRGMGWWGWLGWREGVHQEAAQQASLVTTATAMEQALGPHWREAWAEGKSAP